MLFQYGIKIIEILTELNTLKKEKLSIRWKLINRKAIYKGGFISSLAILGLGNLVYSVKLVHLEQSYTKSHITIDLGVITYCLSIRYI